MKMKNLTMIIAGFVAVAALYGLAAVSNAIADGSHQEGTPSSTETWEHMGQMRDIMHSALVRSEPLDNGIRITVTGRQSELADAIKAEFAPDRHEITPPYTNTEVYSEELEEGVVLTFTSDNTETVEQLQARGNDLFYVILRDNMGELMTSQSGFNMGHSGGMHRFGTMTPGTGHHYGAGGQGMMTPGTGHHYGAGGQGMMTPGTGHHYGTGGQGMTGPDTGR